MITNHQKILLIGCCGSGKSTLAKELHSLTGLPLIHLDKMYYKPNWERPETKDWEARVNDLCNRDRWIMDGNYVSTLALRAAKADAIIYLNINRYRCLYRAIRRVFVSSARTRTDMAEGCSERFSWQLYRFIWNFQKTTHPRIMKVLQAENDKAVYVLKDKREIDEFLQDSAANFI